MSTYYLPRKTCYFCSTTDSGPRAWISDPTSPGDAPLLVHVSCGEAELFDPKDTLFAVHDDDVNDTYVYFPKSLSEAVSHYFHVEAELDTFEKAVVKAEATPGYVKPDVTDWESDDTAVRVYRARLADAEASLRAYTS